MGWGTCGRNQRLGVDMGYCHPGVCMAPACDEVIHHGLDGVCGGMHEGGEFGCGRYFCGSHVGFGDVLVHSNGSPDYAQLCQACHDQHEAAGLLVPDPDEVLEADAEN